MLSTMTGTPRAWATSAIEARSWTSSRGFPISSRKTALVFSLMARPNADGSDPSTYVVVIPILGRVWVNRLYVPPYSEDDDTMLSPARARLRMDSVSAAWPEARPRAATPPSSAATRSSKTAVVGFMIRV